MIVAAPAPAAVSVFPARVVLPATSTAVVRVANTGAAPVDVRATRTGLAIGAGGRPVLDPRRTPPAPWLLLSETGFRLPPHSTRVVRLRAGVLKGVRAGDHSVVLLFAAVPAVTRRVAVAMRIGVVVTLRAPGRLVRRLVVGGAALVRGRVRLTLRNRGNVDEWLPPGRLRVVARRAGRVRWRWRPPALRVLARTSATVEAPLPVALRHAVEVSVEVDRRTVLRRRLR